VFRTWAIHGNEQLRTMVPADPAMDFTPDGGDLALVGDGGEVIDGRTGGVVRTFPGFPAGSVFNTCNAACFAASPHLGWLTYLDPSSATPRIREIQGTTGRLVAAVTVPRLDAQGVAPDGRIGIGYVDSARLYAAVIDPRSSRRRNLSPGASSAGCSATAPSFTPDGRLMAIADTCISVVVWDLRTGDVVRTIALPDRASGSGARLSPDGRYVLVAVLGGAFVRIDLRSGAVIERPGAQTEGNVLAISPNGRFYAIGRQDGTVDVYDAQSLLLVRHHALGDPIQALVFSGDGGRLAVQDAGHNLWVWDTCAICENSRLLAAQSNQESVRQLTPGERATFGVG
jgi:WD40 repeat protein